MRRRSTPTRRGERLRLSQGSLAVARAVSTVASANPQKKSPALTHWSMSMPMTLSWACRSAPAGESPRMVFGLMVAAFDAARFSWAVRALVSRHAALRTLFTADTAEYTQQVMSFEQVRRDVEFELHLRAPAAEGLKAALHAVRGRRQQWARAASYPLFSIEGVLLDGHDANGTCRLSCLFDLLIADAESGQTLDESAIDAPQAIDLPSLPKSIERAEEAKKSMARV